MEAQKVDEPEKIIGGDVLKKNSRPYLVSLGLDRPTGYTGHACGGSRIIPNVVFSVARE